MSELEELEFDQRMLEAAMNNTYLILTGKATYDSLLEKQSMQAGSIDQHVETAVLFNPLESNYNAKFPHLHNDTNSNDLIDSMIDYFVETEEYEKCAELVKCKENKYVKKR